MLAPEGPRVLEFNTRFGDPETQAILPRIQSDLLELLWSASQGSLGNFSLRVRPETAVCVVIAARGYPELFPRGDVIVFPEPRPDVTIFSRGNRKKSNRASRYQRRPRARRHGTGQGSRGRGGSGLCGLRED